MLGFVVPGGQEWLLIVGIVVLLFGASQVPKLARSLGRSQVELEKGREEAKQELEDMKHGDERGEEEEGPEED